MPASECYRLIEAGLKSCFQAQMLRFYLSIIFNMNIIRRFLWQLVLGHMHLVLIPQEILLCSINHQAIVLVMYAQMRTFLAYNARLLLTKKKNVSTRCQQNFYSNFFFFSSSFYDCLRPCEIDKY